MRAIRTAVVILIVSLTLGCSAGTATQRVEDLVARDYHAMSDADLKGHYAQLSDQLARESRAERMAAAGRPTRSGATRDAETVAALRERWNEVRYEMRRRDLLP